MEPKYKVNPLTGELQEYVFEYNGILALRNFTARVEDDRLILHAADDVNFSILEALVSEVEINGVVYDNPTAAQEALTRLTFNQNRPVLLDKTLKDLILGAVQKIPGKKLSTEDFTTELRQKLESLQQVDTSGLLPKGSYTGTAQDLKNLIDNINRILQSDDTDLDQLQEIVTYIKQNKHILSTLGINNIAGLVEALAAKADKNHHHDDRYAPITHRHNEYAHRTHRHNKDDIDGLPANIATTENIKTAIDGIQIGGRNLMINSSYIPFVHGSNAKGISRVNKDSEKITEYVTTENNENWSTTLIKPYNIEETLNKTLTVSFDIRVLEGVLKSPLFFPGNFSTYLELKTIYGNIELNKWIRVYTTFISKGDWQPHLGWSQTNGKYQLRNFKVEYGNTPTDWTPAPEDIESKIPQYKTINDAHTFLDKDGSIHFGSGSGILNAPTSHFYEMVGFTHSDKNWGFIIAKNIDSDDKQLWVKQVIEGTYKEWFKLEDRSKERTINVTDSTFNITPDIVGKTLHINNNCTVNYNNMPLLTTVAIRKVFDGGEIKFSGSIEPVYTGDKVLNGKKGSTAIVDYSAADNTIFIDIRNV